MQDRLRSVLGASTLAGIILVSAIAGTAIAQTVTSNAAVLGLLVAFAIWAGLAEYRSTSLAHQLTRVERRVEDTLSLVALESGARTGESILPWSEWSLTPDAILRIVGRLTPARYTRIVECGAGMSTLYLAHQLRAMGQGHVWSIEHDAKWVTRIQDLLTERGLADWVTIVHAPLADVSIEGQSYRWYDVRALTDVLTRNDVDVLLVDGPPGTTGARARYPALPLLEPCLSSHALVFLDDGYRADEQEVVERWCAGARWQAYLMKTRSGIFQLRRRDSVT